MKKIFVLGFFIIVLFSCSIDNSTPPTSHFEVLPIENVELPQFFLFGETHTITYTFLQPTTCHFFNDLYYEIDGDTRIVAVANSVLSGPDLNCEPLSNELIENSFNFYVTKETGTYTFKFWQGKDENGEDIYLIFETPVIN